MTNHLKVTSAPGIIRNSNLARTAIIMILCERKKRFNSRYHAILDHKDVIPRLLTPSEAFRDFRQPNARFNLAGHGPYALGDNNYFDWEYYIQDTFGIRSDCRMFQFLFGPLWSDDRKQAACRVLRWLERGVSRTLAAQRFDYPLPELIGKHQRYFTNLNIPQLVERLDRFVTNDTLRKINKPQ